MCSRSKRGMSTIALPVATETPMITVRPYTWKSGITSTPRSIPSTSVGFHERDRREPRERDERLGPGVLELPAQLRRGVQRVARDHDRARAQRAIEGDDELRAVGQEQRDAIAFANAERLEARGEAVRAPIELGVRQRCFEKSTGDDGAEDRRDRPRVARGGVREELLEGDRGIGE